MEKGSFFLANRFRMRGIRGVAEGELTRIEENRRESKRIQDRETKREKKKSDFAEQKKRASDSHAFLQEEEQTLLAVQRLHKRERSVARHVLRVEQHVRQRRPLQRLEVLARIARRCGGRCGGRLFLRRRSEQLAFHCGSGGGGVSDSAFFSPVSCLPSLTKTGHQRKNSRFLFVFFFGTKAPSLFSNRV
jgi:hypothetical protein